MSTQYGFTATPPLIAGEVSATADFTLTTTSTLLTGITTTLPIGVWLVWFSSSMQSNGTNSTGTFGLFVGGTLKTDSSRTIQPYDGGTLAAANATGAIALNALVTLTTPTVVQVQGSVAAGSGTVHQRTMNWLKVG